MLFNFGKILSTIIEMLFNLSKILSRTIEMEWQSDETTLKFMFQKKEAKPEQ